MERTEERQPKVSLRKVSKPVMEKKRRARINTCLDQLRSLLEKQYSSNIRKRKLEKADILEMTVKHLRGLQEAQHGPTGNPSFSQHYQAGFSSCLDTVNQYLLQPGEPSGRLRHCVLTRLTTGHVGNTGAGRQQQQGRQGECVPSRVRVPGSPLKYWRPW